MTNNRMKTPVIEIPISHYIANLLCEGGTIKIVGLPESKGIHFSVTDKIDRGYYCERDAFEFCFRPEKFNAFFKHVLEGHERRYSGSTTHRITPPDNPEPEAEVVAKNIQATLRHSNPDILKLRFSDRTKKVVCDGGRIEISGISFRKPIEISVVDATGSVVSSKVIPPDNPEQKSPVLEFSFTAHAGEPPENVKE